MFLCLPELMLILHKILPSARAPIKVRIMLDKSECGLHAPTIFHEFKLSGV